MIHFAQQIIEEFEKNYPIPTSIEDWQEESEKIMLYLAAKKYVERYG
jgi:hypothetical protein